MINETLFAGVGDPFFFAAVHVGAFLRGIVGGTVKMIEAVGDIEGEFEIAVAALGAFFVGSLHIDDQIAGGVIGFAGNGVVAKADHIGWVVFGEVFSIKLGDSGVVS